MNNEINCHESYFADKEEFIKSYALLDKEFRTCIDSSYKYLVNFSKTVDLPVHRWFYYNEGFSPKLVDSIFHDLEVSRNDLVLDPCAGSGTTLLSSKQLEMRSIGFEINPLGTFIMRSKIRNYRQKDLEQLKAFNVPNYKTIKNIYSKYELSIIEKLFEPRNLEEIELLKNKIRKIKNVRVRDLLYVALLSIIEEVSNYKKGGNGLKRKKVKVDKNVFEKFQNKVEQICIDLKVGTDNIEPQIIDDSCMNIEKYNIKNIGISLFSPPYVNCFDPFEIYKMELWIGEFIRSYTDLRSKRQISITSNLNSNIKRQINNKHRTPLLSKILDYLSRQTLWDKRIPTMLDMYFYDIHYLLHSLYKITRKNGYCVLVVGNSAYGNVAIPVDIIISQIGKKIGFNVEKIIVARNNETSSQQYMKLGNSIDYIRESLVVLKK